MSGYLEVAALTEHDLEAIRTRGFGAAYRMLGSVTEAEDIAQEAVLRFSAAETEIHDPLAWVTTVATRLSLDVLRSARVQRETYVGPWLPEPLVVDTAAAPAEQVELADSLSQAFLVMLERLTPLERAAFLLREVFDYNYAELARVLDRNEANCRQIVARARRHVADDVPRFEPDAELRERLFERFVGAAERGEVAELEHLLADDVVLYSDGGGRVSAARKPLVGATRVASVWAKIMRKQREHLPLTGTVALVNGQPGWIQRDRAGTVRNVITADVVDGRIAVIRVVRNPDKLAHL